MKRLIFTSTLLPLALSGCLYDTEVSTDGAESVGTAPAAITVNDYARSVLILVHPSLYAGLQAELATLVADMQAENWLPAVQQWTGGDDPNALKEYLGRSLSSSKGRLAGALFVGDLPTVMADNSWAPDYESGISDYWYMDLDGDWRDEDNNGTFDYHGDGSGDRAPEIFVGRITASTVSLGMYGKGELDLIKGYFKRNHRFRTGLDAALNRSLFVANTNLEFEQGYQNMLASQQQMLPDTTVLAYQHDNGFVVSPGVTQRWSVLTPNVRQSGETRTMFLGEFANRYNFAHVNGHGWTEGFGGLAVSQEIAEIARAGRSLPAIVNAHSCYTARINDMDSMAAVATMGGSLAYIGAGTVMYYADNWDVSVTQALKTKSLGEAIREMHQAAFAATPGETSVRWQSILHLLIGDPTLMASYPAATGPDPDFVNTYNLEVWATGDTSVPNAMPLRLFLKSKGTMPLALSGVKARYYFSAAERPSVPLGLQDHYTPSSQVRLVNAGGDQWYIEYDFGIFQSTLYPNESTSNGTSSGEQVQVHFSDWAGGWQRYNDYSAEGLSTAWAVNRNVDVFRDGVKIYGKVR